ncbi:MAG TPA: diaminopimelate decarboxylase [Saprospiraceae bacterium]|nr:diaminopimelate decarboxylase [Saprospiraceae bacterium]
MNSETLLRQEMVFKAAKHYGSPAYVYDMDQLMQNIHVFNTLRKQDFFRLNYACKANSNINILKLMRDEGLGLDLVSPGEIELALHLGFDAEKLFFTPSNAANEELSYALDQGVFVVADHIDAVQFIGKSYPDRPFGIRLKPDIIDGGNEKVTVGGKDSKFGIALEDVFKYSSQWKEKGYKIELLHAHVGSDLEGLDSFQGILDIFYRLLAQFSHLKTVNIGGGYAVNYDSAHPKWSTDDLLQKTRRFHQSTGLNIMTEPGKFLVSNIGYFVTRVNRKKQGSGFEFLCLDSGFNHFIRPMYYNASHRVITEKDQQGRDNNYRLVGNICEKDEFNKNILLPEMHAGDYLAFINAGAYCYSMASNYNLRYLPKEILLWGNEMYEVTRPATLRELIDRQVLVEAPY